MTIPKNAYLDSCGRYWRCKRGYKKENQVCQKINAPKNAHLIESEYGKGWDCDRGYHDEKIDARKLLFQKMVF